VLVQGQDCQAELPLFDACLRKERSIKTTLRDSKNVFGSGRHAVLLQEGHGHGTLKAFYAAKSLNDRRYELRECLVPMKSALSKKNPRMKLSMSEGERCINHI